jgi:hypothetical protein
MPEEGHTPTCISATAGEERHPQGSWRCLVIDWYLLWGQEEARWPFSSSDLRECPNCSTCKSLPLLCSVPHDLSHLCL